LKIALTAILCCVQQSDLPYCGDCFDTAYSDCKHTARYHVPLIRSQNCGAIPVEMCID